MAIDYKNSLSRYRRYLSNIQNEPIWNASFWLSLTIILVICMVIFFLRPTLTTISGLLGKVKEQKILLARIDDKIKILNEADTAYSQNAAGRAVLEKVLPSDSEWHDLSDNLYQIASDSGIILQSVKVNDVLLSGDKIVEEKNVAASTVKAETPLPPGVEKVNFSLEGTGEYSQIKDCLVKIESVGRILVISNARINKNKDGSLGLTVSGYATFYHYPSNSQESK